MRNGVVYVGSWDGRVYALNAHTGGKLWSYTTGGQVDSSPAVAKVIHAGTQARDIASHDVQFDLVESPGTSCGAKVDFSA